MRKRYSEVKFRKFIFAARYSGDLSEWLKEHAWKVCIRETVSRVRIPQSPQFHCVIDLNSIIYRLFFALVAKSVAIQRHFICSSFNELHHPSGILQL